ncbi:hypothetical protein AOLI_G00069600, partial [Acnodon oligacanthus]
MCRSSYEGLEDGRAAPKELEDVKEERYSPWGGASERESQGLGRESPLGSDARDMYNTEQLVPGHSTYQPY